MTKCVCSTGSKNAAVVLVVTMAADVKPSVLWVVCPNVQRMRVLVNPANLASFSARFALTAPIRIRFSTDTYKRSATLLVLIAWLSLFAAAKLFEASWGSQFSVTVEVR